MYIQLKSDQTTWLLDTPNLNEVISRGKYLSLKYCQPLELLTDIERGFIPLLTGDKGSVGQRNAKLPSIKFLEWFRPGQSWIRADWLLTGAGASHQAFLRLPTLTASNFVTLWPIDPILYVWKFLPSPQNVSAFQGTGSTLRVDFTNQNDFIYMGLI